MVFYLKILSIGQGIDVKFLNTSWWIGKYDWGANKKRKKRILKKTQTIFLKRNSTETRISRLISSLILLRIIFFNFLGPVFEHGRTSGIARGSEGKAQQKRLHLHQNKAKRFISYSSFSFVFLLSLYFFEFPSSSSTGLFVTRLSDFLWWMHFCHCCWVALWCWSNLLTDQITGISWDF